MSDTKRQNARARAAGGFKLMDDIIKNKSADVFYRNAIVTETDRMLRALFKKLEQVYTTIHVNNAAPRLQGRSVKNIEKLLEYYKIEYTPIYLRNSEKIIKKWLNKTTKNARRSILTNLRQLYGEDIFTIQFDEKKYGEILRLIIDRNVGLIDNTVRQSLNNVENIVYDAVTTGQTWRSVAKDLSNQQHIAYDRIKRIARDQTGKANEVLNELTQRDAGIEFFYWETREDERVSTGYGGHKQLQGKIYKWGDTAHYPVVDSYGHRGVPHQRVNCRCTARAVLLRKNYQARQTRDGDWVITKGKL